MTIGVLDEGEFVERIAVEGFRPDGQTYNSGGDWARQVIKPSDKHEMFASEVVEIMKAHPAGDTIHVILILTLTLTLTKECWRHNPRDRPPFDIVQERLKIRHNEVVVAAKAQNEANEKRLSLIKTHFGKNKTDSRRSAPQHAMNKKASHKFSSAEQFEVEMLKRKKNLKGVRKQKVETLLDPGSTRFEPLSPWIVPDGESVAVAVEDHLSSSDSSDDELNVGSVPGSVPFKPNALTRTKTSLY